MAVPSSAPTLFPRKLAIALLALLACSFAANHVAARIAFDDGTGVLLAILCRSGITFLFLACDDSINITGILLPVDGGYTAR